MLDLFNVGPKVTYDVIFNYGQTIPNVTNKLLIHSKHGIPKT